MAQSPKRNGRRKTKALPVFPALRRISDLIDVPDLTAAVVAAALLEGALEKALSKRMCRFSAREHNEIFHSAGPLRNLRPKILMGRALNLYGPDTTAELTKISQIRNEFAHSIKSVSFKSTRVKGMSFELQRPEMRSINFLASGWTFLEHRLLDDEVIRGCPKLRYLKTVSVLIFLLESISAARPRRETAPWPRFFS
jgi:hypothetical protein